MFVTSENLTVINTQNSFYVMEQIRHECLKSGMWHQMLELQCSDEDPTERINRYFMFVVNVDLWLDLKAISNKLSTEQNERVSWVQEENAFRKLTNILRSIQGVEGAGGLLDSLDRDTAFLEELKVRIQGILADIK